MSVHPAGGFVFQTIPYIWMKLHMEGLHYMFSVYFILAATTDGQITFYKISQK